MSLHRRSDGSASGPQRSRDRFLGNVGLRFLSQPPPPSPLISRKVLFPSRPAERPPPQSLRDTGSTPSLAESGRFSEFRHCYPARLPQPQWPCLAQSLISMQITAGRLDQAALTLDGSQARGRFGAWHGAQPLLSCHPVPPILPPILILSRQPEGGGTTAKAHNSGAFWFLPDFRQRGSFGSWTPPPPQIGVAPGNPVAGAAEAV